MLEEAACGKRHVCFVDAAHFVYGAFLSFVWCFARVFIKTPAGRQRLNVLGAIDAITHQFVSVVNQSYINAASVCELLDKLRAIHPLEPITLIMDNARYQHCKAVMAHALTLKIDLLFLPGYSPNLNLIERLWKFIKKQCLNGRYYPTHEQFQRAIIENLDAIGTRHQPALKSLLTLKFQTFENVQLLAA